MFRYAGPKDFSWLDRGIRIAQRTGNSPGAMQQKLDRLDLHDLQVLLINKNREFTTALKMGKKHQDLVAIYQGIKEIYSTIMERKSPGRVATY